jgi:hypothetical protein
VSERRVGGGWDLALRCGEICEGLDVLMFVS